MALGNALGQASRWAPQCSGERGAKVGFGDNGALTAHMLACRAALVFRRTDR